VQALNDRDLKFLGRLHDVEAAVGAIGLARDIFPRMSFDLIYARPGQTPEAWAGELREAIGYAADHLSLYQLTIEEGTPFFALHAAGKLPVPDQDLAAALYETTQDVTAAHGLPAYEISNHARPGAESRHNLIYWRYGDYAGIGPGAHGRLSIGGSRWAVESVRSPEVWLEAAETQATGLNMRSEIDGLDQGSEMLMMGLRLREGIDLDRYEHLAGREIPETLLSKLTELGFLARCGNRISTTASGRIVHDTTLNQLINQSFTQKEPGRAGRDLPASDSEFVPRHPACPACGRW
jgi:oxygen-independent coproporphyrinogen-3 oxidase